jgi:hypothetical protein
VIRVYNGAGNVIETHEQAIQPGVGVAHEVVVVRLGRLIYLSDGHKRNNGVTFPVWRHA